MAKKRKNKKKSLKKERKAKTLLPESAKLKVSGVLMFLLTFFLLFAFFNRAGIAGRWTLEGLSYLIGKGVFLVPAILIIAGFSFFSSRAKSKKPILIALFLLFFGVSGILGAVELNKNSGLGFHFFYSGLGGWLGNIIAWPILRVFGFWVAEIIFFALIVIGGIIFWPFLYQPAKKAIKKEVVKKEISETPPSFKKIFAPKFKIKKIEEEREEKEKKEMAPSPKPSFDLQTKPIEVLGEEKYRLPPLDLLAEDKGKPLAGDIRANSSIIKRTLENFGIRVEMGEVNIGPTVTQYTLKPAEGVKLSKITALANNLSLALASHPLRIEAPIPGKPLVGIEVPNKTRTLVRLRNLLSLPEFQNASSPLVFALGRDVVGNPVYPDLASMPHLLVAGSTGTGKTICLNSIILSLLFRNSPRRLRFILIDPKRVEFSHYNHLPHLLAPVVYDAQKTVAVLQWLISQMEERFEIFSRVGARDITAYNKTINRHSKKEELMPYIVLVIDELADLMAAKAREVESGIVRLAQKARAVGIHLVLATQRPSVEVITGLIKANIIARVAFQVASQVDSRTILDVAGAEKLLGLGDMLFLSAEVTKPKRIQGAYVADKEVERVVDFITKNYQEEKTEDKLAESITQEIEKEREAQIGFVQGEEDPLYEEAKRLVIETRKASASFLQRRLRIGYARAARLLDMLEERGVVGPSKGAKPRDVYLGQDEEEKDYNEF
jgi:S-DNA-T family DNA segregation ATPase FtsK/SpoIIIE